jgi:hypothetical protein
MSIKSLNVLAGAAFAALLFVSVAGSAYASTAGVSAGVPVANPSIAAQNAVVQGG